MKIEDTFTIQSPVQTVWDFLLDIERMSVCVPGVERVEAVDDTTYRGELKVKVGPIAASFGGKAELVEIDEPRRLVAKVEGADTRTASRVTGTFASTLSPTSDETTDIAYTMDVVIRGRLGRFGQGVMREVARQLTGEFAKCVQAQLQGDSDAQAGDGPSIAGIVASSVATSVRDKLRGRTETNEASNEESDAHN